MSDFPKSHAHICPTLKKNHSDILQHLYRKIQWLNNGRHKMKVCLRNGPCKLPPRGAATYKIFYFGTKGHIISPFTLLSPHFSAPSQITSNLQMIIEIPLHDIITYILKYHYGYFSFRDNCYLFRYKQKKKFLCYETYFIFQIRAFNPKKYYHSI